MWTRPGGVALLVGIDHYPLLEAKYQLASCANDARLMAEVLRERFGFPKEGVELLLDEAATCEGIRAGLAALCDRARPGEAVVFYYSGHGSRVRDREGDEPDGWDEAIVPHDGGPAPHPFQYVTDDELYLWVLATSAITAYVTVIADTCYSGTLTRVTRSKWVPPDERSLAELPPSRVPPGLLPPRRRDAGPSAFPSLGDRYVLFAACRDRESADVLPPRPGRPMASVFTYHLCRELHRAPAGATYRDLLAPLRAAVAADSRGQTPQLEGARDRQLFGGTAREPVPYLEVLQRTGHRVRLGGGAVHGVTPGSQWSVSPGGTIEDAVAPARGLVLVDRVGAVSSEAEIVEEASPIETGARAVERTKGPAWMRMAVAVGEDAARLRGGTAVAARILGSPLLLVEHTERADVKIEAYPPRPVATVEEESMTEKRGGTASAGEAWAWAARDDDGELLFMPVPADPATVSALVTDLERLARFRNLLRLADEDPTNPLRGCLEAELLRVDAGGALSPASGGGVEGTVFHAGERLALRIVHRYEAPLYVDVLDLGLSGAVGLLFPVPGANDALEPERELIIGVRPGDEVTVRIPETFAALERARGHERVEGREFLKVFATTHEADLAGWRQRGDALRAGRSRRSRLDRVLWRAVRGPLLRDDAPADSGEHWTVVTLDFLVRSA